MTTLDAWREIMPTGSARQGDSQDPIAHKLKECNSETTGNVTEAGSIPCEVSGRARGWPDGCGRKSSLATGSA